MSHQVLPRITRAHEALEQIQGREDFVNFVRALLADHKSHPNAWENGDLTSYLEALAAWVADMDGYYKSKGESVPDQPTWKTLGQIMLAATVYE